MDEVLFLRKVALVMNIQEIQFASRKFLAPQGQHEEQQCCAVLAAVKGERNFRRTSANMQGLAHNPQRVMHPRKFHREFLTGLWQPLQV